MSRPTRTGLRITTILVSMVVGVVAVILVVCIALFLDRYRSAIVQNARTSSAQAVSQVSNTVSNYLQDMSQAMQLVIGSLGESPDSRDELLDAFADLADLAERLSGQCGQHVRDAEFLLADDPCMALLQQFVVGEQAARDGVLDGRDAQQRGVRRHPGEQLVETQAGEDADLPVVEVAARCRFVIASCDALYCDLFHSLV